MTDRAGELLLGIDVGTSSAKAVLATPAGTVAADARAGIATLRPGRGRAEQDPEEWWAAVATVVREAVSRCGAAPRQIRGIGVSGQGCAVTLVDRHGGVVRPAIIWMDVRAEREAAAMRERLADEVLRVNGKRPAPYNAEPSLMWLAAHEPQSLRRARYTLTTTSYVTFRLTGAPVVNVSDASVLFAFDLAARSWSDELIDSFGLPRRLYPQLAECSEVVGGLTASAASTLGLEPGTPVVAGGEDTSSAGLALGVVAPGEVLASLGTAGTVYVVQQEVRSHPQLLTFLHVVNGSSLIGGSTAAMGAALDWCRRVIGGDLELEGLTHLAAESLPGANGVVFLPYLSGELQPINDGRARGVLFGLSEDTTRADLVRAMMEGAAFALAHNLDVARRAGVEVNEVRAAGAPARSALWCQILADAADTPVSVPAGNPGAPLGDALLAGHGVGLVPDLEAGARSAAAATTTFEPDEGDRERYLRAFSIYRELYPALERQFAQAAG